MKINTLIGEKIKKRRKELSITQKALAGNKITRNMLSLIENGAAMPSFDTAVYLAESLSLPLPYLFSSDFNLFLYEKAEHIDTIKNNFKDRKYQACMRELDLLSGRDDETEYLYARSAYEHAKELLYRGSMLSASKLFETALQRSEHTVYDTSDIKCYTPLFEAVIANIQAPLLEFDEKRFSEDHKISEDFEFYKYILQDAEYDFENHMFKKHLSARSLIRARNYYDAIPLLLEIEEMKNRGSYNSVVLFGVYSDLENAYKQTRDFENAYRYSSKIISMMNGFKL